MEFVQEAEVTSTLSGSYDERSIPVIDIGPLLITGESGKFQETIGTIGWACRHVGFFYIANHCVPEELQEEMVSLSRLFFSLEKEIKSRIDMKLGGKAWRGYFAVGDEFTSGVPDQKEGASSVVWIDLYSKICLG
jgi:isopenicillin N synthase-like dioxygenase